MRKYTRIFPLSPGRQHYIRTFVRPVHDLVSPNFYKAPSGAFLFDRFQGAAFSGPVARNVPNAQGTVIFWLTAMGHLHMFRALPAGRTARLQGERSSAGRATDF